MSTTDTREERLPQWAQAQLRNLRARVADLEAATARTVADTDTVLVDYVHGEQPLPPGSVVRFTLPPLVLASHGGVTLDEPTYLEARVRHGKHVELRTTGIASGELAVYPWAANVVHVSAVRR